jgi:energy-coupling factor transporter ATP-binding protein EcfA2
MDRQQTKATIHNTAGESLIQYLETIEDQWGIKYGNECDMTSSNVYNTIVHYFLKNENDAQDDVARRHEDAIFQIGEVHRRFRDIGELDDMISNRCNRICELLFYADMVLKGVVRMKVACKVGYTPLMNNEVGINRFRPMMCDDLLPQQMLILFMLKKLAINNYRKCGDKVMQAVFTKDGHYTTAWKEVCTIEEFIHKNINKEINFEQWQFLTSGKDIDMRIASYLEKHHDHEFPVVKKNRHAFAFKNGVYFTAHKDEKGEWCDKFYRYGDKEDLIPNHIVSCKYNDVDLEYFDSTDPSSIPTPVLDIILKCQKYTDEELYWLYVFLGRLVFDVGTRDGWQVMMYLKGQAGSGKSTIINSLCKIIYEAADVGIISNNTEKQFGLGSIADKFLVLGPEIKCDFKLEQAEFQSMVSGEAMSVAQKYKNTKEITWKAPLVFAGNEVPAWVDNAGSLQRRMVIFQFNEIVRDGDTQLGRKIEKEYPNILLKSVRTYMQEAKRYGHRDVWNILPKRFTDYKNAMAESTNSLISFLRSDRVKVGAENYVLRKDFITTLRNHAQEHGFKVPKWHIDYYSGAFAQFNIKMQEARLEYPIGSGQKKHRWFVLGVKLEDDDSMFLDDENNDL